MAPGVGGGGGGGAEGRLLLAREDGAGLWEGDPKFEARLPVLLRPGGFSAAEARPCLGKRLCSDKVFIKVASERREPRRSA